MPDETEVPTPEAQVAPSRAAKLGHNATSPWRIPWRGWRAILMRTLAQIASDRVSLAAAGCGFYWTLALFPGLSMLIFLYGLVFDPVTVEPQLQAMSRLLPPAVFSLIDDRVRELVSQRNGSLTAGLLISFAITVWSAAAGTKSVIAALNVAYDEVEKRGFLRYQGLALGLTLAGGLAVALTIAILVALPTLVNDVLVTSYTKSLVGNAALFVLLSFVMGTISVLYRVGPSRSPAAWVWIVVGAAVATLLWLLASIALSYYITDVARYSVTYGPLGAVVAVMMWFYVSAYAVLLGAELNAQTEHQTAIDTTTGPPRPRGERGAVVADVEPPV